MASCKRLSWIVRGPLHVLGLLGVCAQWVTDRTFDYEGVCVCVCYGWVER